MNHERHGSVTGSKKDPNGTLCVKNIKNRDRPIEKAAYDKRLSPRSWGASKCAFRHVGPAMTVV